MKKTVNHIKDKNLLQIFKLLINKNPQACETNEIPQGFGEFGLSVTNPIPVNSILENDYYLSSLRLADGSKIRWKRVGSTYTNNINSCIYIYEIFSNKGVPITYLYISSYHLKTSEKAPKGFKKI